MFKTPSVLSWPIYVLTQAKLHPDDPIQQAFHAIDWSFIPRLTQPFYSDQGASAYPPISLFKALLLIYMGEASSERDLANKLKFNVRLQLLCDFDFFDTPSHAVFSQFRARLGADTFYAILHQLIAQAIALGLIQKKIHTAVDATHIWAFSNKFGIKVCTCTEKCQCLREYTDSDAKWGHKTKTYTFFGYKIHLIVDVDSQLPIDVIVTSGEVPDNTQAIPLLEGAQQQHPDLTFLSAAMDTAYDDYAIYERYTKEGIAPIIPLNPRNTQGKTQLGHDLLVDPQGIYYCARTQLPLVKNGTDPKRKDRQKIVCSPTGCRKACPFRQECCGASKVGKTFYLYPNKDLRLIGLIPRGSRLWKALYAQRTAIERTNSSLKSNTHQLDRPRVRGVDNIQTHAYLSICALIVKAIGRHVSPG
jgi:IS5 family transposase